MISSVDSNDREFYDFCNDPKRREREDDYINREMFPTLDLSMEGIQESIAKVWRECQQGQELLREIDYMLAVLYSRISVFSSSSNPSFSLQSISELDSLVKEYEAKRALVYESLARKVELKGELERLYLDFVGKQCSQHGPVEAARPLSQLPWPLDPTQMSPSSDSDWSMANDNERDSESSCLDELSDQEDDRDSTFPEMSIPDSHSTNFEYIQQGQSEESEQEAYLGPQAMQ
ncbi:hypothetical protein OIY81_2956 [Cryptosporidium canis]|uniref:Uncharacterized protein n=1 Tax=Cryptosporidium canis TaxID=195482 RepID=A0ABQ8P3K9_9CRYT|nr:hypothetical protein OJ252_3009 [Cryptosporidium canis]KAJ1607383.1 hypothetical protein OIY81_2956 [Cryptosporidium canis]